MIWGIWGLDSTVLPWCDSLLSDPLKPSSMANLPPDGTIKLALLQPGDKFRVYEDPEGNIAYCKTDACVVPLEAVVIQAEPSMIFGWTSDKPNPHREWADNECNRAYTPTVLDTWVERV